MLKFCGGNLVFTNPVEEDYSRPSGYSCKAMPLLPGRRDIPKTTLEAARSVLI